MLRSSPTARARIDTPANTPPVNWRPWATRTSRIIPRESRDGWKLVFQWRRLLSIAPRLRKLVSFSEQVCAFGQTKVRASTLKRDQDSVAIWTGSETSRPSQQFSSSGEACTRRPSWVTGIRILPIVEPPMLADPRRRRSAAGHSMIRVVWPSPCDPEPPSFLLLSGSHRLH